MASDRQLRKRRFSRDVPAGAAGRAWRALKSIAVPFADAMLKNARVMRALGRDREFLFTKLVEKDAAKAGDARFHADFDEFRRLWEASGERLPLRWEDRLPCLGDRTVQTPFDRHYLYHPAWAARVLAQTRPGRHVDISSILSFSATVSAFLPVDFFDFRPARVMLDNLNVGSADLLALPFADNSVASLSCLHVIEHIGLGRYGDPIDPDGDLKSIHELVRVLAPGGNLLIATPVGRPRIDFNAHRVYDHVEFRRHFAALDLIEFALIKETTHDEGLVLNPPDEVVRAETYGCGCYWFRKPQAA